ncbi:MAG: hypothetical protein HY253_04480 [Burkholderiales bacterium]|nr:hypothetical protein [Burkholderiales bacterium]
MMRFLFCFLLWISFASLTQASCLKMPIKDFSSEAKVEISSKIYTNLGKLNHQCWYFRDVVFKNGHGQQAIVVSSEKGKCLGFFRVSLAESAELIQAELKIKSAKNEVFSVDLANGIPKWLLFDGDVSNFERCR